MKAVIDFKELEVFFDYLSKRTTIYLYL